MMRENADLPALVQRFIGLVNQKSAGRSMVFQHESGLTFPQIIVLYVLNARDETVSSLAAQLRMSMGATSQLVDKLVEAQMIDRIEDASDRRVRLLKLRPAGRKYLDQLHQIRHDEIND